MRKHVLKAMFMAFVASAVFTSLATAQNSDQADQAPKIEELEVVPEDAGHGDDVYVGAKVTSESPVKEVWFTAESNGERVARKGMWDSNNDNYYATPVSFKAEGDRTYSVELNACDASDRCTSLETSVTAECSIGVLNRCIY